MHDLIANFQRHTDAKKEYARICEVCQTPFMTTNKQKKYCCADCQALGRLQKAKITNKAYRESAGVSRTHTDYKTPEFVSVDGEAIKHGTFLHSYTDAVSGELIENLYPKSHYVMLQADGIAPLFAPCLTDRSRPIERLTTLQVLDWFMNPAFNGKTIIGYYLNYDFENWLADLSDEDYLKLQACESVEYEGYELWYIPKKIFSIKCDEVERKIYDYSGYWQRSFLKTVDANLDCVNDEEQAILEEGKNSRSVFTIDQWEKIAAYNQVECQVLTKIARKSFDAIAQGFIDANINITPRGKYAYSPKCLAVQFYKSLAWKEKHPIMTLPQHAVAHFTESLGEYVNDKTLRFPFSAAYYGGRIEASTMGRIDGKVYACDIRSAYPKGLSTCPEFKPDDMEYFIGQDALDQIPKRKCGMFLVEWSFPSKYAYYPFPFRSSFNNVYFPSVGRGWVSSLEFYAALDTIPHDEFKACKIEACALIKGTDNRGAVNYSETGDAWENAFNARLKLKKAKQAGEYGIKLLLNAGYGATIQQIGVKDWLSDDSIKYFNDFVGMWITAYCRATVWLEIAQYRKDKDAVLFIQTDGVYTRKPLTTAPTDERLGCWEVEEIENVTNIMSGVYSYEKKGKLTVKQRGYGKGFDYDKALASLYSKEVYEIPQETFIPRGFALHQKNKLKGCALQWIMTVKECSPSLASKRISSKREHLTKPYKYFAPKSNVTYGIYGQTISKPFNLKFESNAEYSDRTLNDEAFLNEHVAGNESLHAGIEE